jgi:hypothetical protein
MREDMTDSKTGETEVRGASSVTGSPPARSEPPPAAQQPVPDYEDPEVARADIDATRARMSETIDVIEDRLVQKKVQLQDRLDIAAPVRSRPWQAMGIALGSGLLLGFLTGGEDGEVEIDARLRDERDAANHWERRAKMLERRSRRLLSIAREQEEELERHRPHGAAARLRHPLDSMKYAAEEVEESVTHGAERVRSDFSEFRDSLLNQLARYLSRTVRQQFAGGR